MINRVLYREIERLTQYYPVIVLTGPRQSGKTTLCRKMLSEYKYFNLEDIKIREQIAIAPKQFLEEYAPKGLIMV